MGVNDASAVRQAPCTAATTMCAGFLGPVTLLHSSRRHPFSSSSSSSSSSSFLRFRRRAEATTASPYHRLGAMAELPDPRSKRPAPVERPPQPPVPEKVSAELRVRLREEVEAPFRKVRQFLYAAGRCSAGGGCWRVGAAGDAVSVGRPRRRQTPGAAEQRRATGGAAAGGGTGRRGTRAIFPAFQLPGDAVCGPDEPAHGDAARGALPLRRAGAAVVRDRALRDRCGRGAGGRAAGAGAAGRRMPPGQRSFLAGHPAVHRGVALVDRERAVARRQRPLRRLSHVYCQEQRQGRHADTRFGAHGAAAARGGPPASRLPPMVTSARGCRGGSRRGR
eukprot:ctg_42.g8